MELAEHRLPVLLNVLSQLQHYQFHPTCSAACDNSDGIGDADGARLSGDLGTSRARRGGAGEEGVKALMDVAARGSGNWNSCWIIDRSGCSDAALGGGDSEEAFEEDGTAGSFVASLGSSSFPLGSGSRCCPSSSLVGVTLKLTSSSVRRQDAQLTFFSLPPSLRCS